MSIQSIIDFLKSKYKKKINRTFGNVKIGEIITVKKIKYKKLKEVQEWYDNEYYFMKNVEPVKICRKNNIFWFSDNQILDKDESK